VFTLKAIDFLSPLRRIASDRKAAPIQVTFDPRTPDVTRLHVIPLKTNLVQRTPSVVLINGWHMFLVGPSWSDLLRFFIQTLNEKAEPGRHLEGDALAPILGTTIERMRRLYPSVSEDIMLDDLNDVVGLCIAVAHGIDVSPEIQSEVTFVDLARHMKAPFRMDLLVSPMTEAGVWQCSLHCKGCYATGQQGMKIDQSLSTEAWKAIIDRCQDAGIPQVTFTGGEPTERHDLIDLVDHARWHITRLNTNGVNLSSDYCRKLFDANLDAVQVTLYSGDAAVHDDLVGKKGAWTDTVEGIRNAVQAGLSVSVNTPLVRENGAYDPTLHFIKSLGVKYVTCSGLILTGSAPDRLQAGAALSGDELMEILRKAVKTAESLDLDLLFTSPGWLSGEQMTELGLPNPICGACLSNMAVMPNGAVSPCQSWLEDPGGLGNLLTTPWKSIWNRPVCKKMRAVDQEGCPLNDALMREVKS
jgi:MoaA/NifB/PqqE/SkfB family radical SAM enzyme